VCPNALGEATGEVIWVAYAGIGPERETGRFGVGKVRVRRNLKLLKWFIQIRFLEKNSPFWRKDCPLL
jgi:hypothetical protein